MKILMINPNSNEGMTDSIRESLQEYVYKGDTVDVISNNAAPASIESFFDEAITTVGLLNIIQSKEKEYDGFVIACHSDPGLNPIREITEKPCIGIGEASMLYSIPLGDKFSVISIKEKALPKKYDLIKKYGLMEKCASVRASGLGVGDIEKDEEITLKALTETGRICVEKDGAEVLILGCAGMAGFDKKIENILNVPVIDGVICGYMMTRDMINYRLNTSKIKKYQKGRKFFIENV